MYTTVEGIPPDLLEGLYKENKSQVLAAISGDELSEEHLRDVISDIVFRDIHPNAVLPWLQSILGKHRHKWQGIEPMYDKIVANELRFYELDQESLRQLHDVISKFVTDRSQQLLPLLANGELVKTDMYDLTMHLLGLYKSFPSSEKLYDLIDKVVEPSKD